jgi:hypothetical protein
MAASMLALPLGASAQAEAPIAPEGIGWSKFFDLTACAVGIATISSGVGFVLAGIACGKAATEWWTT